MELNNNKKSQQQKAIWKINIYLRAKENTSEQSLGQKIRSRKINILFIIFNFFNKKYFK